MVTAATEYLLSYTTYKDKISQKGSSERTEQGKIIPVFIGGLWNILGVMQWTFPTFPHHVEWLQRIVDSEANIQFERI